MMDETEQLQSIYRHSVLDHSRNPRNLRRPETVDRMVEGHNPLCGDKLTIYLHLIGEKIQDLSFEGTGCAICMASASIMTETLKGRSVNFAHREIDQIVRDFRVSDDTPRPVAGEMAALAGVRNFPSRIKCAVLAWKTIASGLLNEHTIVTTED